jgi:hypothetical protein
MVAANAPVGQFLGTTGTGLGTEAPNATGVGSSTALGAFAHAGRVASSRTLDSIAVSLASTKVSMRIKVNPMSETSLDSLARDLIQTRRRMTDPGRESDRSLEV